MSDTDDDAQGTRRISDAQTLRALTHPTRLALIEELSVHGAMTATEAAERVGETPSNCSFHLRQLARYGFVEEAGGGTGRRRPWKVTRLGFSFSNEQEEPAAEIAAAALSELLLGRQLERLENWRRTRGSYSPEWRAAASSSEYAMWLTPDELEQLNERLQDELRTTHRERLSDPSLRPEGALPVEMLLYAYPLGPAS